MAFHNHTPGHLTLTDAVDGHVVWGTALPSVQLIPGAAISISSLPIAFPDFVHNHAYYFYVAGLQDVCDSFVTLLPGEWGPGLANNLAPTLLGTVPAGTDYLDVRVNLTRTVDPYSILGNIIQVLPQQGAWVNCPSGSCILEFNGFLARSFDVVLEYDPLDNPLNPVLPRPVYLKRYQSLQDLQTVSWRVGNGSGQAQSGWTHSGSGAKGWIVYHLDSKAAWEGSGKYKSGGGNACRLTDDTTYNSTYTADFLITPGRYSH